MLVVPFNCFIIIIIIRLASFQTQLLSVVIMSEIEAAELNKYVAHSYKETRTGSFIVSYEPPRWATGDQTTCHLFFFFLFSHFRVNAFYFILEN
jgi:hypothetical protein